MSSHSPLEGKTIVLLLGSRRPVPPVGKPNTISWRLAQRVETLSHLDIRVISQWDPELETSTFDRKKFLHVKDDTLPFPLRKVIDSLPYRVHKYLWGAGDRELIKYYCGQAFLLRKLKPDIVVTHVAWSLFLIAKTFCPKAKHIYYHHSNQLGVWSKKRISVLYKKADGLVTLCKAPLQALIEHYGPPPIPTKVIYNEVDVNIFNPERCAELRPLVRKRLGLKKNDLVLLYAGRLSRSKGVDKILRAFSNIQRSFPNAKLIIAGDENYERSPDLVFAKQLRAEANRLSGVYFVGWIPYMNMNEMYAAADISILASEFEGTPMFLLESMACGVPVIATAVGGVPEVVRDGETGILVPPDTVEIGLEHAIQLLLNNAELRRKMGEQAANYVAQFHSIQRAASEFELFLEEVISQK